MIRPGKGVFNTGLIDKDSLQVLTDSFSKWKNVSEKYVVDRTITIATSALRTAKNSDDIVEAIYQKTGYKIRVISGSEEARLIAKGILKHTPSLPNKVAFVDIGGGSTEISLVEGGEILWSHSFPLGSQRLKQMFPKINPPSNGCERKEAVKDLRAKVVSKLTGLSRHLGSGEFPHLIGTAGTIKAIGRILNLREARMNGSSDYIKELTVSPDSMEFTFSDLRQLAGQLEVATRATLSFLEGLEAKRRDLIIPGTILLEEIAAVLHSKSLQTSSCSLRDGILLSQLETLGPEAFGNSQN
jgi:exopolyphosphatase/guanosine-5'-triphosphate,3'-diphosphate pyrophosphatase